MKLVEIRSEAELHAMRADWNGLLQRSASNTIFLTWEWISSWWKAYGDGELRILTAVADDGTLAGIAPLYARPSRKCGQSVTALYLIGDGSSDSDYLDFIAATGSESEVFDCFRPYLTNELRRGAVLCLNEVPATSPNVTLWNSLRNSAGAHWIEEDVPCGALRLPQTWDEYLSTLKPRFRTRVRSVLRNLENRPEARFGFCESRDEVERALPGLFDLHTRRWAQDGRPGVFRGDAKRHFYFELSATLADLGWLRVSTLEWDGRLIACEYGFVYNSTYFHLQEGYEPSAEHWSIGIGLRAWTMRRFIQEGLSEYDFLGGMGRHKADWGASAKLSKRIQIANLSPSNVVFCRGPQWNRSARDWASTVIPERLLKARQARRRQQIARTIGEVKPAVRPSPTRTTAANWYVHLQLPRVVRSVRERWQLSVSGAGRWPRVAVKRRTHAAARILYYHRVNDNGDAFSPALPTAVFEQQMRHIAASYRVVSLGQALEHLESGSPETVLAITFDDGYEDNYRNAFPILEKYGLTATIFLTTGAIDSREPLWFERLATAVKTTSAEYLDVEIDIPRRFWMRTDAERAAANKLLFSTLRKLSDQERRTWLDHILRRLPTQGDPNGSMLTWDQVRSMNERGIGFGAHTVTHPFVSKLNQERMKWEITESKRRIEQEVQSAVDYFAYPNGRGEDFDTWNKAALRAVGYRAAVTTMWGLNYRSTDLMELRRGQPWEENAAAFACKLDWYDLTNH